MADLLAQPRAGDCRHGLLRRPDDRFRPPLCIRHRSDRPQRPRLDQRHKESDGGMGSPSDHGGISLGRGSGYMIRTRDRIYGGIVTRRLRAMGIRDKPIAPASPWQNGFAERLIGSMRRECLDHIIVFGEAHLRRILKCYADYYNNASSWIRVGDLTRF